jgi:hypothetical protein
MLDFFRKIGYTGIPKKGGTYETFNPIAALRYTPYILLTDAGRYQ